MEYTLDTSIGDIVAHNIQTARYFEGKGIDFCCGGRGTLEDACAQRSLNAEQVLEELRAIPLEGGRDVRQWSTDFLIDFIVNTHHQYVRSMLPKIAEHAAKVAFRHGDTHPETVEVEQLFLRLRDELAAHLIKEEQILFPYIRRLAAMERGEMDAQPAGFGSVAGPISVMEAEHEGAGRILERMHAITDDLTPPADACATYTLLYREIAEFEQDLHMHIHLENNVLHPRAFALEQSVQALA
ncbi:MAG TPA: iron-sulfur cluster repair di-iron protein [Bacteroidota bacterium]|nr:iron-sulfur cluster repair di-iron protein [Bacteroidota bacterium]